MSKEQLFKRTSIYQKHFFFFQIPDGVIFVLFTILSLYKRAYLYFSVGEGAF